ncbi:DEAD/DEAH box helicase [Salibacterium lacus]|uniref:DEAD/DEAH box helicase n=1 Tax=Salibacterium lacus TaxID=1898109 RepID=A0ABW5T428_9BACI
MNTFQLLSENIQRKIWEEQWTNFYPVQDKTIPVVMNSDKDVIISSGTASGKTEAAFFPAISLVEREAVEQLKIIYISPLKALINNQFERIEKLCEDSYIPIHRWHGDVSQSQKRKMTKKPAGILQITPESIESLFINRTELLQKMFQNVSFIVIDEIHAFIDKERGVQLRSLLYRMQAYAIQRPRIIGLSATINNSELVKNWVNPEQTEKVEMIESAESDKKLLYNLIHLESKESGKKPLALFEDIRKLTKTMKAIIFCNSRGEVEEATHMLNRLSDQENQTKPYYAHHSSIDKAEREHVEKVMSESQSPKSIVATSSLELGIDIGSVDIIIQLDNTFTVSSLKQRLGRSGRKINTNQILQMYTTSEDSLLQSLAVMELNLEKWVEPAIGYHLPFDILFHQILSILQEKNGMTSSALKELIAYIEIFQDIEEEYINVMLESMVTEEYIEIIHGSNEMIVGLEGERILRHHEFYSAFKTSEEYEVRQGAKKIGSIDKDPMYNPGDNIILAGNLWTIQEIDEKKNKIYVSTAVNGKPPKFTSGAAKTHPKIAEKAFAILCSNETFTYVNEDANDTLNDMRKKYHMLNLNIKQRVIWEAEGAENLLFETYTGSTIVQTLVWMLRAKDISVSSIDQLGRIELRSDKQEILDQLYDIKKQKWQPDDLFPYIKEDEWFSSKYSVYLPSILQRCMHAAHEMDITGVIDFLERYEIITS